MRNNKSVVLVCDDSLLIRTKLKDSLLNNWDVEVVEAADGQASLDAFKQNSPDLVFLDIVMPIKDGLEVLREMKSLDSQAKVVMVSSAGTQEYVSDALSAGAVGFIQKPLELSKLEEIMKDIEKRGVECV